MSRRITITLDKEEADMLFDMMDYFASGYKHIAGMKDSYPLARRLMKEITRYYLTGTTGKPPELVNPSSKQ